MSSSEQLFNSTSQDSFAGGAENVSHDIASHYEMTRDESDGSQEAGGWSEAPATIPANYQKVGPPADTGGKELENYLYMGRADSSDPITDNGC